MILAGLVSAGLLYVMSQSRDNAVSALVPRRVTPTPSRAATATPTPTATAGGPASATTPPTLPTTTPTPRPSTDRQQAEAIQALLDQAARTPVSATVAALATCNRGQAAAQDAANLLTSAADSREDLLGRLAAVPVGALPDGATLKAALTETWTRARSGDRAYVTWAQGIADGSSCNPQDPFKLAGDWDTAASRQAGTQFLDAWNTVAPRLGLARRTLEAL